MLTRYEFANLSTGESAKGERFAVVPDYERNLLEGQGMLLLRPSMVLRSPTPVEVDPVTLWPTSAERASELHKIE